LLQGGLFSFDQILPAAFTFALAALTFAHRLFWALIMFRRPSADIFRFVFLVFFGCAERLGLVLAVAASPAIA
jgi:hypothetical protein